MESARPEIERPARATDARPWQARRLRHAFAFAAGAALVVALVAYLSVWLHRQSQHTAHAATRNVVTVVETHLDATLHNVVTILDKTAGDLRPADLAGGAGGARHAALAAELAALTRRRPELLRLAVHDLDGTLRLSASRPGLPAAGEAVWLAALVPSPADRLHYSDVVATPGAPLAMVLSRTLRDAQGVAYGFVSALLDLQVVETTLASLDLGAHGLIGIRRVEDGRLVLRAPRGDVPLNRPGPFPIDFASPTAVGADAQHVRSPRDGHDRLTSFRRLAAHPFVIHAGVAREDYLRQWRRATWTAGTLAALAIALAGGYLVIAQRAARRKAEHTREILARESLFGTAIATMKEGLFVVAGDPPRVRVANRAAERMGGVAPDALTGKLLRDLPWDVLAADGETPLAPADRPSQRVLRTGVGEDGLVMCLRRRDGSCVWVSASAQPLERDADTVRSVLITFSDVTAERRSLEALQRSEALLQNVVGTAMDAVITADSGHRIVLFNAAAERIFGYAATEAIGQPLAVLVPEEKRKDHPGQVERFAARGGPRHDGTMQTLVPARRKDGTRFPAELSVATMVHDGKRMFTAVVRDATARVEAEQALKTANATLDRRVRTRTMELEQANRELEAFSYSVSHDLRAPLRAMHGFASLLRDHLGAAADDEARRLLSRILAGTGRMGRLIDDVLRYSRLTRVEITRTDVDVDRLAGEVAAELHEAYPRTAIVLHPLGHAQADAAMLRQILQNLMGNGCKYSADAAAPAVHVGATRDGARVEYWVRDNGVGFSMDHAGKLFGMFERLHTDARYPGTGVGLAVVKRLVERHAGRVGAEAAPGRGATFSFTLG